MPQIDKDHVKLQGGIVVWDGVTQPEQVTQGLQAGKNKYTLKAVFPPTCPDLGVYDQLAQQALQSSKFRGVLPPGGRMPISPVQQGKYDGMFDGWFEISFKSTLKIPDVYMDSAVNGPKTIDPMQLPQFLFTGQKVDVLAHCYEYDAAGNKGISGGLDAIDIIVSANATKLNLGGYDTSAAFGGGAHAGQNAQTAGAGYQPAQQQPNQGAPAQYGQNAQTAAPQQQANFLPNGSGAAGGAAPGYQDPNNGSTQAPAYGATTSPSEQEPRYRTPQGGVFTAAELRNSGWPDHAIQALPQA